MLNYAILCVMSYELLFDLDSYLKFPNSYVAISKFYSAFEWSCVLSGSRMAMVRS
jgi:hypothetical protein